MLAISAGVWADDRVKVVEGFEVTLYADDNLAHSIHSLTIDSAGQVVVAGPGYVKRLHDSDGDGVADRATLFSNRPRSGAHGMCFDGTDLICTGDNALMRLRDQDGDGKADGDPEIWAKLGHGEHGANGIVKGPDGWFYLISGNDAGVSKAQVTISRSPIDNPSMGTVVRIAPDGRQSEVLAHGFRNPYDLAINSYGHLFTVDADNERDQHLPWYAPTRLFDVAQGMHHGWMLHGHRKSWNRPHSFFDNVERLVEIGRGSPTGVEIYRHRRFPKRYRDGVFSVCWTFGRIYFFPLEPHGATYKGEMEIFMQSTGHDGFAPVDMAVGPSGDLFVAIGGRNTRGGVFRVRYTGTPCPEPIGGNALHQVLGADQPLASWSRAHWVPKARPLGRKAFEQAVLDDKLDPVQCIRAVEVLTELFGGLSTPLARQAVSKGDAFLTARIAWALSRRPASRDSQKLIAELTGHEHPWVRRAAWEALATLPFLPQDLNKQIKWQTAARSKHRRLRAAMVKAARRHDGRVSDRTKSPLEMLIAGHIGHTHLDTETFDDLFRINCAHKAFNLAKYPKLRLEAVRLMMIGLSDIRFEGGKDRLDVGYTTNAPVDPRLRRKLIELLAPPFPTGDNELDHESARLLSMLEAEHEGLLEAIAGKWTAKSSPVDDVHYLTAMTHLPGRRSPQVTAATAKALLRLHPKLEAQAMVLDHNWPQHVGEAFDRLSELDPKLPGAVISDPDFAHIEHTLFALRMGGGLQQAAARKFLKAGSWSPQLVDLAGVLPEKEILPLLRKQFDNPTLRERIALVLAHRGDRHDQPRLVAALDSRDAKVAMELAKAIEKMKAPATPSDLLATVRALQRHQQTHETSKALIDLLRHWSGADLQTLSQATDWFSKSHPQEAASLRAESAPDLDAWQKRLAGINFSSGNANHGRAVFETLSCAACHLGSNRLGPSLKGIATRFDVHDLFMHTIDPNAAISPAYDAVQITTNDGELFTGGLIYDSPDGIILETGPGTVIRITGDQVAAREPVRVSPMPEGLLDQATDEDLADLYGYLKTMN